MNTLSGPSSFGWRASSWIRERVILTCIVESLPVTHVIEGAGATAWFNGAIDDIRIYNRALSTSEVRELYQYEVGPIVTLIKSVKPLFSNLTIGTNYQLQVSTDLLNWTNSGSPFTATNSSLVYPQYFDVPNWNQLFFRLQ